MPSTCIIVEDNIKRLQLPITIQTAKRKSGCQWHQTELLTEKSVLMHYFIMTVVVSPDYDDRCKNVNREMKQVFLASPGLRRVPMTRGPSRKKRGYWTSAAALAWSCLHRGHMTQSWPGSATAQTAPCHWSRKAAANSSEQNNRHVHGLVAWRSGNAFHPINEVALRQAGLVL